MHTAHGNGIPSDNRLTNLRHCTPMENIHDKFEHGTIPVGKGHHAATVTEAQVREIRTRSAGGERPRQIARSMCVSEHVVSGIVRGITWRHVA
jgi:hypothetical protein